MRSKLTDYCESNGIDTYAFISPYLPHLSDIEQLIEALDGWINKIGVEALNVRGSNWVGVEQVLTQFYPELFPGYKELAKDDDYWNTLEARCRHLTVQRGISFMGFYRH